MSLFLPIPQEPVITVDRLVVPHWYLGGDILPYLDASPEVRTAICATPDGDIQVQLSPEWKDENREWELRLYYSHTEFKRRVILKAEILPDQMTKRLKDSIVRDVVFDWIWVEQIDKAQESNHAN